MIFQREISFLSKITIIHKFYFHILIWKKNWKYIYREIYFFRFDNIKASKETFVMRDSVWSRKRRAELNAFPTDKSRAGFLLRVK